MAIFLGLDCGGSSSRALALDDVGNRVYERSSGSANLSTTPYSRLRRNIASVLDGAPVPTCVCGCFAGLIDEETRLTALTLLREVFPDAKLAAVPDFAAAYYAFEELQDICIVAGTGSVVCSSIEGEMVRSGGRGYLLGDQGSAFAFGRDAFNRFLDDPENAGPALRAAIQEEFHTVEPTEAIRRLYSGAPAPLLARLAKAVATDQRAGHAYATEIMEKNFGELAKIVRMHVERYLPGRRKLRLGLAGGLWRGSSNLREAAMSALQNAMPEIALVLTPIKRPPVYGAVVLAKELMIGN